MPLCKKSDAVTTLKNGKTKLNKGYREVVCTTGRKMYFSEEKKKVDSKVDKKKVVRKKKPVEEPVQVPTEEELTVEM